MQIAEISVEEVKQEGNGKSKINVLFANMMLVVVVVVVLCCTS